MRFALGLAVVVGAAFAATADDKKADAKLAGAWVKEADGFTIKFDFQTADVLVVTVMNGDIHVMSQPRPVRTASAAEGWTAQSIAERAMPALESAFSPIVPLAEVFRR